MLKGKKVYLRLLERKDLAIIYRLCNEEKVKKYNSIPENVELDDKSIRLRKALSIINEKNVLVGFITYKQSNYSSNVYSIGITIGSRYWNRGYGQDSIKTLNKYLFEELKAIKVELEVIVSNTRAIRCYKKCGFFEEKIIKNKCYIDGKYLDTIIMGILRNEMIE